jgi:hypothetical protein
MLKNLVILVALGAGVVAFGATPLGQDDKSTHHAAMHAEHTVHHNAIHAENWLNRHLSAPHNKNSIARRKRRVKSVHHAAMHAEHWIDHHVSAPHKTGG